MAEVEYTTEIARPVEAVWQYVERLENWAPLVIGFQRLQVVDDRQSIWTLRGDVGVLAREVDLQAHITVWEPGQRVEFTVQGLTEQVEGDGQFLLEDASADASPTGAGIAEPPPKRGWWRRLRMRFARFLLRRMTRRRDASPASAPAPAAASADDAGESGRSRLTFRLRVSPGGAMAPMVEVLMEPMLEPAAEDLARGIREALEGAAS